MRTFRLHGHSRTNAAALSGRKPSSRRPHIKLRSREAGVPVARSTNTRDLIRVHANAERNTKTRTPLPANKSPRYAGSQCTANSVRQFAPLIRGASTPRGTHREVREK